MTPDERQALLSEMGVFASLANNETQVNYRPKCGEKL